MYKNCGVFINLAGNAVLNQIFAFELLHGGIREGHVAAVVDIGIQLVKFFATVICDDVAVVFACFGQFFNVIVEVRRFEFAISDFA